MDFKEKPTSIQIGKLNLLTVYQLVSTHGEAEIEAYRKKIEDLHSKMPRENLPIIRGDHNSHISKRSERPGTAGEMGPWHPHQRARTGPSELVRRKPASMGQLVFKAPGTKDMVAQDLGKMVWARGSVSKTQTHAENGCDP